MHSTSNTATLRSHRRDKVLVPIDIPKIANGLRADLNSVFGRLYYHLDPLYGQEKDAKGA